MLTCSFSTNQTIALPVVFSISCHVYCSPVYPMIDSTLKITLYCHLRLENCVLLHCKIGLNQIIRSALLPNYQNRNKAMKQLSMFSCWIWVKADICSGRYFELYIALLVQRQVNRVVFSLVFVQISQVCQLFHQSSRLFTNHAAQLHTLLVSARKLYFTETLQNYNPFKNRHDPHVCCYEEFY